MHRLVGHHKESAYPEELKTTTSIPGRKTLGLVYRKHAGLLMQIYSDALRALFNQLNEYQKEVVNIGVGKASVIGVPGSGKCIAGSSLVLCNKGLVRIDELVGNLHEDTFAKAEEGLLVPTLTGLKPVTDIYKGHAEQLYTIKTRRGYSIEAIAREPLYCMTDDGPQWINVRNIEKGDFIALYVTPPEYEVVNDSISTSAAYVLGAIVARGTLYRRKSELRITKQDKPWLERLRQEFAAIGISSRVAAPTSRSCYLEIRDIGLLLEFAHSMGINPMLPITHVPKPVLHSGTKQWRRFLCGYVDTVGSVTRTRIDITARAKQLASELHILLAACGIWATLRKRELHYLGDFNYLWRIHITGEDASRYGTSIDSFREGVKKGLLHFRRQRRNTNVDIVPISPSTLDDIVQRAMNSSSGLTPKECKLWRGYVAHRRNPSRLRLRELLDKSGYTSLLSASGDGIRWDQVRSIAPFGFGPVYDLRVAEAGHFVANGVVAHNTSAIVARVARIAADGLDPDYILCMTFTRAAASEMTRRLQHLGITNARVGTIHSVCREILAAETSLIHAYRVDEKNSMHFELKKLLTEWRKKKKINQYGVDIEAVDRFISYCKAAGPCYVAGDPFGLNLVSDRWLNEAADLYASPTGLRQAFLISLYTEIERTRSVKNVCSFDDMLLWAWMLLLTNPEARTRWRNRWSLVIVDEAQDSTAIQWDIARFLTGLESCIKNVSALPQAPKEDSGYHNLMVGGQPEQSIYSWRNASCEQFIQFSKEPGTTLIRLPINYRSNQHICDIASKLVYGKSWAITGYIEAAVPEPNTIGVFIDEYPTMEKEAEGVIDKCLELSQGQLRKCGILARLRVSLDLIEIECIKRRIRYIKRAGGSFADSKEIKDILAYLRVVSGCDPDGAWSAYIINRPFRYIGKQFIARAANFAAQSNLPLYEAIRHLWDDLSYRQRMALRELFSLLDDLRNMFLESTNGKGHAPGPSTMLTTVLDQTDYINEVMREEGLYGMDESRMAVINHVVRAALQFTNPIEFLAYMDELADTVRKAGKAGLKVTDESNEDALVLSTVHGDKGLEHEHVFIVDAVQGKFPCLRANDPDEELRLMYVAMTRAARTCHLSSALTETELADSRGEQVDGRSIYVKRVEQWLEGKADYVETKQRGTRAAKRKAFRDFIKDGATPGKAIKARFQTATKF